MTARVKEGDVDVTVLAQCGRKRKITKQDKNKIEKRVREVPDTSTKRVQHWFLTETSKTGCRETMRKYMKIPGKPFKKNETAFPFGCTQGQALALVHGDEAQDRGGARPNSNVLQIDAQNVQ